MLTSKEIIERMRTVNRCMKDSVDEKNPDASISKFIEKIGSTVGARAIYIYSLEKQGGYTCSYYWKANGATLGDRVQVLSINDLDAEWIESFHAGNSVVVEGMEHFPILSSDYDQKKMTSGEKSLLILTPIILEKELYGFVIFVDPDRKYMALENQMFEIDANFLAIMLRHKHNADYILESSTHDELTGVLSINAFWNYVTPLITGAREGTVTRKMAVVFMDIRHFKIINGTVGHADGDMVLKELGKTIRFFADTDAVGRSMADHFYLCIEDEKAEGVIQRIHDYMEKEAAVRCDVKAGIYRLDGTEISASLAAGRAKMACDKISENRYQYYRRYDEKMEKRLVLDSYVDSHIDEALENEWIKVYYHPIINLIDGAISSYEALARWNDPVYGMLSPADFIEPLEESWILYKLDLYMIDRVCRRLAAERDEGKS